MKKLLSIILSITMLFPMSIKVFAEEETNKLTYIIEPQFYSAEEFNKYGIARVQLEPLQEGSEGVFGVINLNGERVFGFDGTKFTIRKNGLIMAVGYNDKAAFFSSEGKQLTEYVYETFKRVQSKTPHFVTYHYLTDVHDGDGESDLVPICRDGKFGFINSKGEETIAPTFDYVFGFYEGISKIGYNGVLSEYGTYTQCKYGYINENGDVLPTGELWQADDFSHGYAKIADGQIKVIDKSGNEVKFPIGNYEFLETNGNFILVTDGNGLIVLDMNGNILSGTETGHKFLWGKSFIIGQKQIADVNGTIIYTAPEGTQIDYCRKNSRVTMINATATVNKVSVVLNGLVNQDGEVVLEPNYLGLREVANGIFAARGFDLFDTNGSIIGIIDGYSCGGNKLSYNLLPLTDYNTDKRGYVEIPEVNNEYVSKYTESNIYKVYNVLYTEYGTVLYLQIVGTPHATGSFLMLIRETGEEINLSESVLRETPWACPEHNDLKISDDGRYITFNVTFDERSEGNMTSVPESYVVSHDAGTYYYKADLETGTCIETRFEPLNATGEYVISDWATADVEKAKALNIISDDVIYRYRMSITREQLCNLVYNYITEFGKDLEVSNNHKFKDTDNVKAEALSSLGIIKGKSETEFAPNDLLTREEAATILERLINVVHPGVGTDTEHIIFADSSAISDWAMSSIQTIYKFGIMKGVGNNNFAPKDNYTTEQAIVTLVRVYANSGVSK